jgi:replicative DNA helicase
LAKELKVPVLPLSQLNRSLGYRDDKRPKLSDLRESGSIEQDADVVLMIYRQEVYTQDPEDGGKAEVFIRKQRNGPLGTIYLQFDASSIQFRNYEPGMAPEYEDYG